MNKGWIYVLLTCLAELLWVYGFNVASTWWHWVITVGVIIIDFHFLAKGCERLPTGTVYAVFAAVGTVGIALMDVFVFGSEFSAAKGLFVGLLLIGIISLNLSDRKGDHERKKGVE